MLVKIFIICILMAISCKTQGVEQNIEYEEGVAFITLTRKAEPFVKMPANVTVITRKEIQESNAQTVVELLTREKGIVVRDYFGFGTKSEVDMKGFGETGASNCLVLVNGRRVNEIDLSNVDWTLIPLDQVERIEIVHNSGSVMYGDNAVGGVINIITKKAEYKPSFRIGINEGSYSTHRVFFDLTSHFKRIPISFRGSRLNSDGFRQNNKFSSYDFSIDSELDITKGLNLRLEAGYNQNEYGMPGSITQSDWEKNDLRKSYTLEDNADKINFYFQSILTDNKNWKFQLNWRNKKSNTNFTRWRWFDTRYINTFGISPQYMLQTTVVGKKLELNAGIDFYLSNQKIDEFTTPERVSPKQETQIAKRSLGLYLNNIFHLSEKISLNLGGRFEDTKYDFEDVTGKSKIGVPHQNDAMQAGVIYYYTPNSNIVLNINKNFRLPKTDEYYSVWTGLNKELKTQKGLNINTAVKHQLLKNLSLGLNLYNMSIENEIYYDPYTWKNTNYEFTTHQGAEFEVKLSIADFISMMANYTYTNAFFPKGVYKGKKIPLVPEHKFYLTTNLKVSRHINVTISNEYVGERYFGSDQKNERPKMSDYNVVNLKVSFTKGPVRVFGGVNNLTNVKYSPFGYYGRYYPAPDRNFFIGTELRF